MFITAEGFTNYNLQHEREKKYRPGFMPVNGPQRRGRSCKWPHFFLTTKITFPPLVGPFKMSNLTLEACVINGIAQNGLK